MLCSPQHCTPPHHTAPRKSPEHPMRERFPLCRGWGSGLGRLAWQNTLKALRATSTFDFPPVTSVSDFLLHQLSWFYPSQQLSTTQLLAHSSPLPVGWGGESKKSKDRELREEQFNN